MVCNGEDAAMTFCDYCKRQVRHVVHIDDGYSGQVMPELHSPFGYYYSLLLMGAVAEV